MSEYLQSLRHQTTRAPAIWVCFTTEYRDDSSDLFLFVEGQDDAAFYGSHVRPRWTSGQVRLFRCNGKSDVLGIIPRVEARLAHRPRALYFVDKDLDDFISPTERRPRLFETEVYSIENYIAMTSALRIIAVAFLGLPDSDVLFGRVTADFNRSRASFIRCARVAMAWFLSARRTFDKPNLSNISPEHFLTGSHEAGWRLRPGFSAVLRKQANCANDISFRQLRRAVRELRDRDASVYIRGKFDSWFLASYLRHLATFLAPEHRVTCCTQISEHNVMQIVGPAIATPPALDAFLRSVLPAI